MPFNQTNGFESASHTTSGDKQKTNFKIGKIYGTDGILDITTWNAPTGVRIILSIKQAVGKDPSTGMNVYEQKKPNELPRFFMNIDAARAFLEITKKSAIDTLNFSLGFGSKLNVSAQGSTVKLTITSEKTGTRTITLDGINCGNTTINAAFLNLISFIEIGFKKALTQKLDPDEFGMVVDSESNSEDAPF